MNVNDEAEGTKRGREDDSERRVYEKLHEEEEVAAG